MGLIWSMSAEPGWETTKFVKRTVLTPLVSKLYIYPQFLTMENLRTNLINPILCSEIPRWYKAPCVKRLEVEDGSIRGTLFIPIGKAHVTTIIQV